MHVWVRACMRPHERISKCLLPACVRSSVRAGFSNATVRCNRYVCGSSADHFDSRIVRTNSVLQFNIMVMF